MLRDRADADEALQQVFLKLLEAWESVQPETAKGWLFTVAYHEAMLVHRRRDRDDAARARLWARPVWQAHGEVHDPQRATVREEVVERVRRALEELPPAQRDVVERRLYRDQTFAAIAGEIGCPLGTVLTRMRLAVEKLRQRLEEK
jgi:RNA polymerase sigma-70 factor (ECF subfamily)